MRSVINQLKCLVAILCLPISIDAQDYFGIGNTNGVSTSASSTYQDPRWDESAIAFNTLNAKGFIAERYDAARFLTQATLGFGQFNIDEVVSLGKEGWVDDQFTKGPNRVLPKMNEIISAIESANGGNIDPNFVYFNYAWWSRIMSNNDLLRHRIAVALSEILVISRNSTLSDDGEALASYYDVLYDNAFGNYKDILMEVTYHPAMGDYLDHLNNPKSDPSNDQFPDENYAREILQLFSIGLFELNTNGTRKKANGEDIPTYDNDDILEYAKVFTGLSFSALQSDQPGSIRFGRTNGDWTKPMRMFEDEHEPGQKRLLRGQVVPAGQTGDEDIEDAITGLFNHPNVGPFLAYRLIQRLTTSNPSMVM